MKTESLIIRGKELLLLLLFVVSSTIVIAQREDIITIPWGTPKLYTGGGAIMKVPYIEGQSLDGYRPNFSWGKPVAPTANYKLDLEILETTPASSIDLNYLKRHGIVVSNAEYELVVANANTDRSIALQLFPYIRVANTIRKITKVKIKYDKPLTPHPAGIQKDFVANSALQLGSGYWYKISVTHDGIHKISKSFLEDCGIDVSTVNPLNINIYGNGDGKLPEENWLPRTDDLAKNAIIVVGESDGVFDDGDYILFYAWGPHRWDDNGTSFDRERNPYSDVSTYFININSADPALRVSSISNSPNAVTHNVNTYSYYDVYENDFVNLVNGGQRWYGEAFDANLQQSFPFNVASIDNSTSADIEVTYGANANGSNANTMRFTVNGVQLRKDTIPNAATDYGRYTSTMQLSNPSSSIPLTLTATRSSPDIEIYLDRIKLNARSNLNFAGSQLNFRDLNSVGIGNVADYSVTNLPTSGFVWEVSDRHEPKLVSGSFVGSTYQFQADADSLRTYVASDGNNFFTPSRVGAVAYQNLHGLPQADYLIITNPLFITQANRLADLHRANGLTVHVVTDGQIYNEFGSGMVDAVAIRMFAKMFYDRGAAAPDTRPQSLLLFGDGTFDPKGRVANNNNYMLTYQSALSSEDHVAALVIDDFFGLLDDSESILGSDALDIGVGRLLISNTTMAKEQVDKIQHYMHNGSDLYSTANTNCSSDNGSTTFGDWRTVYVQIADDEENQFINNDCEAQYANVTANYPEMNCDKIYLDAYQQVITAGGQRYPDVVDAINDRIERGALVINYVGHGGEVGVAEERVITVPQIQAWRNIDRLPLIVSATCEFTKYDDPDRVSAGEWASINAYGAAIALMTTTRSVYYSVNEDTGEAFFNNVFERDANHEPKSFGEIIRLTKNEAATSNINKRSFTLIGDPALQIALPRMNIVTDSINGLDPAITVDTIQALSRVTIKGHLEDFNGNILTGFNGVVYPSVFDKPKIQQTLQNDPGAPLVNFETQTNRLYKGKVTVANGYFTFTFVVPKDINYSYDFGKISFYAENGVTDAIGEEQRVLVGGVNPNGINDDTPPQIELYLNDEGFVNGGITDESPRLIAKLFDENGINAVGNGIGHDLTVILDDETSNPIVLNDYYVADLDSYQSGEVRYNFQDLEPGSHTLTLKVWDVNNNSAEARLDFIVKEEAELNIDHVLNYPNPFTTHTDFYFEHNQVCSALEVQIQIFTVSGRLVKTINQSVHTDGYRSQGIPWDGLDDFGDQLAKGVYVYRVIVKSPNGTTDEKIEKLVILKQ
ncbi:MAG: type IX secretion system sortase PorU [Crocinitomicaceae bacterium]|nr:type IX secretion system sortase PorU [Crocinitomicaceae bacterium]